MPTSPSLTEILHWIDPDALPDDVVVLLLQIGPFLARELTYKDIGRLLDPPRSSDYVSAAVKRIRDALVEEALRHRAEMSEALKERLEEIRSSSATGAAAPRPRTEAELFEQVEALLDVEPDISEAAVAARLRLSRETAHRIVLTLRRSHSRFLKAAETG